MAWWAAVMAMRIMPDDDDLRYFVRFHYRVSRCDSAI
jgi:hypothetical protein